MEPEFDHNIFVNNLARANVGEVEVAKLLNKVPILDISLVPNKDNRYDLIGTDNGLPVSIEVKEDYACDSTGNVVVEFESRGKRSGIYTTKATIWVFRIHMNGFIEHYSITTKKLKELIVDKVYDRIKQMWNTDSNNRVYLFKYGELIKYCHCIGKRVK